MRRAIKLLLAATLPVEIGLFLSIFLRRERPIDGIIPSPRVSKSGTHRYLAGVWTYVNRFGGSLFEETWAWCANECDDTISFSISRVDLIFEKVGIIRGTEIALFFRQGPLAKADSITLLLIKAWLLFQRAYTSASGVTLSICLRTCSAPPKGSNQSQTISSLMISSYNSISDCLRLACVMPVELFKVPSGQ